MRRRRRLSAAGVRLSRAWSRFWLRWAGRGPAGRLASRLAALPVPPYKSRTYLAGLTTRGYVSPSASIRCPGLRLAAHVFIGDRVIIYQTRASPGGLELGDRVRLHREVIIELGQGGSMTVGRDTHVQPRCIFSVYKGSIHIGAEVQVAPMCAFYSYDHTFAPDVAIRRQALATKGGIVIEDDAWLGVGVTVLDGVTIGRGAVIGAGAVVTESIPEGAIAVGVPARVVGWRGRPAAASGTG